MCSRTKRSPGLSLHLQPCSRRPTQQPGEHRTLLSTVEPAASLPAARLAHPTSARSLTPQLFFSTFPVFFMQVLSIFPCQEIQRPFLCASGRRACGCCPVEAELLLHALHRVHTAAATPRPTAGTRLENNGVKVPVQETKMKFPFAEPAKQEGISICRAARQCLASSQAVSLPPGNRSKPTRKQKAAMARVSRKSSPAHIYLES